MDLDPKVARAAAYALTLGGNPGWAHDPSVPRATPADLLEAAAWLADQAADLVNALSKYGEAFDGDELLTLYLDGSPDVMRHLMGADDA